MAKRAGAYRSEKRKKEIARLKKQEEKRQRRLKKIGGEGEVEGEGPETDEAEEGGEPAASETEEAAAGEETSDE